MEKRFKKLSITQKRKKPFIKVSYDDVDVTKDLQQFNVNYVKTSNQPMSKALSDAVENFVVHLLHASEMIDGQLDLGEHSFEDFVSEHHFKDDERYKHVYITSLEF